MPDAAPDLGAIPFRRRRDAGDVINATVRFLRANARELLRTYLVVVLPVALATGISWLVVTAQMDGLFTDPATFERDFEVLFGPPLAGVVLFSLLGQALTAAAAGAYVRLYRRGEAGALTAGALWDEARPLVLPFTGFFLLLSLGVGVTGLLNVIPCLGTLVWLAVLAWALPRAAVLLAVRTLEAPTIGAAWTRASGLVKGAWGFALGALVLAFVVYYGLIVVASIPYYVLVWAVETNAAGDPTGAVTLVDVLLVPLQVIGSMGTLIPLTAAFFVHGRLVEDLDGTGLYADLDALAGEAGTAPRAPAVGPSTPPEAPDVHPGAEPPDAAPGGFRGGGFGR